MQQPIKFITSRLSGNSVQCKTIGVHSIGFSSWCTFSVSVCCEAEENPLEFITSSGLHYRFLVYPQLSAHVITPVIDFFSNWMSSESSMQSYWNKKVKSERETNCPVWVTWFQIVLFDYWRTSNSPFCIIHFMVHCHPGMSEAIRSGWNPFPGANTFPCNVMVSHCNAKLCNVIWWCHIVM